MPHSSAEIETFAKTVKVGDRVSVWQFPHERVIYHDEVVRVTPTGRIRLMGGAVFKPNGFKYGDQLYRMRYIWKPQD